MNHKNTWKNICNALNTDIARVVFTALQSFFFALYLVTNGYIISFSDRTYGPSASSLALTIIPAVLGPFIMFFVATGLLFSKARGAGDYKKAGDVLKTALRILIPVGLLCSLLFGLAPFMQAPSINANTSYIATAFICGNCATPIFYTFLVVAPQITMLEKDNIAMPISSLLSWLITLGIGLYFLGKKDPYGMGAAGSIAMTISSVVIAGFFFQKKYKKYALCSKLEKKNFSIIGKELSIKGLQMMITALCLWGHPFGISMIVGSINNTQLAELDPSVQYTVLLGVAQEGFAEIIAVVLSHYEGIIAHTKNESDKQPIVHKIKRSICCFGIGTTIFYAGLLILLCLTAIDPMIDLFFHPFFSNETTQYNATDLTKSLLIENLIILVPNNIQLLSIGILVGWGHILKPNLVFLGSTVLGLAAGYGLYAAEAFTIAESMVVARLVTTSISAGTIGLMLRHNLGERYSHLQTIVKDPRIPPKGELSEQLFPNHEKTIPIIKARTTSTTEMIPTEQGAANQSA